MEEKKIRAIAHYLPQFHPIPENNKYWGNGFTEWTNVARAKPLFRGHMQPRIPADTGFYDLRLPETRELQAKLAREAGIEGFCYWHYWFGNGKEVLQRPFDEVVQTGKPDFPFCLGWALQDWTTKTWEKGKAFTEDRIIFKQEFPGTEDDIAHFYRLLPAFQDKRYIKVDGKLLFPIFLPKLLLHPKQFMDTWNRLAVENGLEGFHFVAYIPSIETVRMETETALNRRVDERVNYFRNNGFDAVELFNNKYAELKTKGIIDKAFHALFRRVCPGMVLDKFSYAKVLSNWFTPSDYREDVYPQVLVGWDRSPREGRKAIIYYNDTPECFGKVLDKTLEVVENKNPEHRIVFLNSWNEWGEGAYLEPDLRYGNGKLTELRKRILGESG